MKKFQVARYMAVMVEAVGGGKGSKRSGLLVVRAIRHSQAHRVLTLQLIIALLGFLLAVESSVIAVLLWR